LSGCQEGQAGNSSTGEAEPEGGIAGSIPNAPGWRDFVAAQRLRAEGKREQAAVLYRSALGLAAAQPFARFGLACLGEEDPAAILASSPGLFFALRCRARQGIDRFRRRESSPADLLDILQQAGNAGWGNEAVRHFRRLAEALQVRQPAPEELSLLFEEEPEGAAKRNAGRIALELTVRRLSPAEALPVLRRLAGLPGLDDALREQVGRQLLRLALLLRDPAGLEEAGGLLAGEGQLPRRGEGEAPAEPCVRLEGRQDLRAASPSARQEPRPPSGTGRRLRVDGVDESPLPPARALLLPEPPPEGDPHPTSTLLRLARTLGGGAVDETWREQVRSLRASSPHHGVAQSLLLQEAASRGDVSAVGGLLEEADAWRNFRAGPPRFVLRALSALAAAQPNHPLWKRVLPRWLQPWNASELGAEAAVLLAVAGAEASEGAPEGVDPAGWLLHQAAHSLLRDNAVAALAFSRRALASGGALPDGAVAVVEEALPALQRKADAQALAGAFGESGATGSLLVDLVDLLRGLPEGAAILEAARRGDSATVQSSLDALGGRTDVPARLHHHLALLAWRSAGRLEERGEPERSPWEQAWRHWLGFLGGPGAPGEADRDLLLDHLLGVHRRRINDLLARSEVEGARRHHDLVLSLPSLSQDLQERVARFRDSLATEYLLTTREAMRHGAVPEGWRADYDRGLALLVRLLGLERDNVRLLTALVEVCGEWFFDLYNLQDARLLGELVARYTPFALHLARLVEDRPGELPARLALAEFTKVRGFLETDRAGKIALYREALRFDPGNANVLELLAQLGVTDPRQQREPTRSDDD
jgi:hypothetical protein